jgi:RNA polymerase sigma factor (sigma-70 family)
MARGDRPDFMDPRLLLTPRGIPSVGMTRQESTRSELTTLVQHVAWVQRLARRLVRDDALADDLVQDACLAALQRPGGGESVRAWLATVVRNGARQAFRGDQRRAAREAVAARHETLPSACDVAERVATHRAVVDAVLRLDDAQRDTVLMRYFDGLTPAEIAERTGVPVATVKSRLQRGLDRLRSALAEERGPGGLAHALAPLLVPFPSASVGGAGLTPIVGILAMGTFTKLAVLSLLVAGGIFAWSVRGDDPSARPVAAEETAVTEASPSDVLDAPAVAPRVRDARATAEVAEPRVGGAVAASSSSKESAKPAVAALQPFDVRGRVLGVRAEPLPNVDLVLRSDGGDPRPVPTDAAGTFVLSGLLVAGEVVAASDAPFVTLLAGRASRAAVGGELLVVLAPRLGLGGHVRDTAGRPIEGACVEVRPPSDFRARFEHVLDHSIDASAVVFTDRDGAFALDAPGLADGELVVSHDRYVTQARVLPPVANDALAIVLHEPSHDESTLSGIVLDVAGRPVPGARVAFGVHGTLTGDDGGFRFDLDDPESPNLMARRFGLELKQLTAVVAGHLPAVVELELDPDKGRPLVTEGHVLRLGGPLLSLHGRVVDAAGEPVRNAQVWVRHNTLFEFGERGGRSLEALVAGRDRDFAPTTVDDDGRFELTGMLDQECVVAAHDPETLLRVERTVQPGAAGVTLLLDSGQLWRRVAGKVVDREGRPVPGVTIVPATDTCTVAFRGRTVSTYHGRQEQRAVSNDEGEFELERVPRELVYLRIDGAEIISDDWGRHTPGGLAELSDGRIEDLRIEVRVRMRAQVFLSDPDEADRLRVLRRDGSPLRINLVRGDGRREVDEATVERDTEGGGRTEVLTLDDSAATLVLLRGDEEVRRVTLALQRGVLNRVDI